MDTGWKKKELKTKGDMEENCGEREREREGERERERERERLLV
jgi:hypothetical protein